MWISEILAGSIGKTNGCYEKDVWEWRSPCAVEQRISAFCVFLSFFSFQKWSCTRVLLAVPACVHEARKFSWGSVSWEICFLREGPTRRQRQLVWDAFGGSTPFRETHIRLLFFFWKWKRFTERGKTHRNKELGKDHVFNKMTFPLKAALLVKVTSHTAARKSCACSNFYVWQKKWF